MLFDEPGEVIWGNGGEGLIFVLAECEAVLLGGHCGSGWGDSVAFKIDGPTPCLSILYTVIEILWACNCCLGSDCAERLAVLTPLIVDFMGNLVWIK